MTEPPADERQRSLPGEHPKSLHDDPEAAEALTRILASESYREASEDLGFLNEDLTRGLRLQLEYLKAETLLRQHDIRHTVVVFGSARVAEPQAARRRLDAASTTVTANPSDADASSNSRPPSASSRPAATTRWRATSAGWSAAPAPTEARAAPAS